MSDNAAVETEREGGETGSAGANREVIEYGDYGTVLDEDGAWEQGGFELPDGRFWEYREPDATIIGRNGRLRVRVMEVTNSHDRIQVLDNAKHMYYSSRRFHVPDGGRITFDFSVAAQITGADDDNLYDGFVSVNLLDFETGAALDFFTSNRYFASVYGRVGFPGVEVPEEEHIFCFFEEHRHDKEPGDFHDYRITYDQGGDWIRYHHDGELVKEAEDVPMKIEGFIIALGLMTEIDISVDGSVSCHGQGITGEWSPFTITVEE